MSWKHKHLLGLQDLSRQDIELILETAKSFKEVSSRDIKKVPALRGKTVVTLFFEPSTRTRISFELAAKRLGANVIGAEQVNAVDARGLHQFLGVGRNFANWIQERVDTYGFQEHRDFEVFIKTDNNPKGGRPSKEYVLSVEMAKEVSMMERNAKGKEARQYFIECERRLQTPRPVVPAPPVELLKAQAGASMALAPKVEILEAQVHEIQNTPIPPPTSSPSKNAITVTLMADILGITNRALWKWLRETGYVAPKTRQPLRQWLAVHDQLRVTGKGVVFFQKTYK